MSSLGSAGQSALSLANADLQPANPWFSWKYVQDNHAEIQHALAQHVTLTVETMVIALIIAFPLALVARRYRRLATVILGTTGVLYTIPSLGLFAFLAPFTGLISQRTVLIGLVTYALLVLVRNMVVGLNGVPADVRESARGMGYGPALMLWRIELPVALPTIMAGIRIATVTTVALITVGVLNGNGGLGQLILRGFNNNFYHAEILTNSILCVALALVADLLLALLTRALSPWARRQA